MRILWKKGEKEMAGITFYLNSHVTERKPSTPACFCWSSVNEFSFIRTHKPSPTPNKMCEESRMGKRNERPAGSKEDQNL